MYDKSCSCKIVELQLNDFNRLKEKLLGSLSVFMIGI